MALEDDAIQRAANEIEFALRKDDDDAKVRALDTIIRQAVVRGTTAALVGDG